MSWIKENKFLAGFAGVTLVGAGALGFLLFQAKGQYEEAQSTFDSSASELATLQGKQPFPNAENVKKLEEQRKAHVTAIAQLQQSLSKVELPLEQVSPQQFQDRLRATVDSITQKANENGVKRAQETTNLDFDRYLSEPPRPEAAPGLARQLKAIELLVTDLIKNRVAEIREINRGELPEERSGKSADTEPKAGGKAEKGGKELVKHSTVQLGFVADQRSSLTIINDIVGAKEQFFIPRVLSFKNEKETGPLRNDPTVAAAAAAAAAAVPAPTAPGAEPAAAPAAPGAPAAPAAPTPGAVAAGPQRIIVGEEKIEVTILTEIVDFAEPATTASK